MNKSSGTLWGILTILCTIAITICFFVPVFFLGLLKLIPINRSRLFFSRLIDIIIKRWIFLHNGYMSRFQSIDWEIIGDKQWNAKDWHLIIANHQSWVDILVLQKLFAKKIPIMKFFVKDSLKWVPLLGFVWWAMGCPFMKRYSHAYLQKKPHKKGKDLAATHKAMTLFKQRPVTVMNFVEGTRFTSQKKNIQQSPYQFLLKPKAGGISFSVNSLSERINSILDVTIIYPHQRISFWDYICRRINRLKVIIREVPIPASFLNGNLLQDEEMKACFRDWLNEQWAIKDRLLANSY